MSSTIFIAGAVCTVSCLILLLPWLRTVPHLASLPSLPWLAGAAALATMVVTATLLHAMHPTQTVMTGGSPGEGAATRDSWADVADALGQGVGRPVVEGSAPASAPAESMDSAILALQGRLAKGGGSNDDWELLAKSYEFLGRPQQASQARAHQLPALSSAPARDATQAGVAGEVMLAAGLSGRAPAGTTLFIVAKSVDSPGAPVAVYRGSVGTWPMRFNLDDGESMLPGRKLSGAGRVTIEARISQSGQPLAAAGDLQGVSGVINPRDHKPVTIVIDKVIL